MHIYLDYNASAPARQRVVDAMTPHFRELHGNPSSTHFFGQRARAAVEDARNRVAELIQAVTPEEILFVSGGTEADNMVLSAMAGNKQGGIVYSSIEHPAITNMVKKLAESGVDIYELPVSREGLADLKELEKLLTNHEIALVTIMAANNETGVIEPLEEIAAICREHNALLHTDAAQMIGKAPFSVQKYPVDFATIASHKMGGPLGIGALYIRNGLALERYFEGGSQEINRRPGTESVPLIVGLGEAAAALLETGQQEQKRMRELRDHMEKHLLAENPQLIINSGGVARLCNTSSITVPGVSAETLVIRMDLEGFAISSGSACHSGRTEPSRILKALGLSDQHASSSIRVSLGPDSTQEQVDNFANTLTGVIRELKDNSISIED